jgi:hypothetical protein
MASNRVTFTLTYFSHVLAMVQAIHRRHFTTQARFPSRVVSVLGFVVDKVALGEFL